MITTLSFLIKNIYYFFENIIKKYKYFSDTLKGKTDSILLFHKRYEITEEKKQIMIKFMKFYDCWKKLCVIFTWIVYRLVDEKIQAGLMIIILLAFLLIPTQFMFFLGGIYIIRKKHKK